MKTDLAEPGNIAKFRTMKVESYRKANKVICDIEQVEKKMNKLNRLVESGDYTLVMFQQETRQVRFTDDVMRDGAVMKLMLEAKIRMEKKLIELYKELEKL
ncbi:MAG: hypothetical protein ACE5D0_09985 [Fidelibacterota bacterium]